MTTEAPPPHETTLAAMLVEDRRDNLADDARAQQFLDSEAHRTAVLMAGQSKADTRHREFLDTYKAGPGITKREAAVYILANLTASTSATTARRVLTERLAILDDIAPL